MISFMAASGLNVFCSSLMRARAFMMAVLAGVILSSLRLLRNEVVSSTPMSRLVQMEGAEMKNGFITSHAI